MSSEPEDVELDFDPMIPLTKDLRKASRLIGVQEARALVRMYYRMQKFRIQSGAKIWAAKNRNPDDQTNVLDWSFGNFKRLEDSIKSCLGEFAKEYTVGKWMQSICGIGPVISAGLLAHYDIREANTAAKYWAFAGLDPTKTWEKGKKRPWNANLKLISFFLGECFVKVNNNPKDFYGKLYKQRKTYEIANNERKQYEEQAKKILEAKRIGKDTEAYKFYSDGRLPPAHIHARARRYAVKIFLSHLHFVSHLDHYGVVPPIPFLSTPMALNSGHTHFIQPPNWPLAEGGLNLKELYSK